MTGYSDSLGLPTDGVLIETKVDMDKVKHYFITIKYYTHVLGCFPAPVCQQFNRGITCRAPARHLESDIMVIDIMSRNALTLNRWNSLPCTVRTSRQRSCNLSVGCKQLLGSIAYGPTNGLALGCYQPSPEVLIIVYVNNLTM